MQHGKNDDTDELKRQRRALIGKIDRRYWQIVTAQAERSRFRDQLAVVEAQLRERGALRKPKGSAGP